MSTKQKARSKITLRKAIIILLVVVLVAIALILVLRKPNTEKPTVKAIPESSTTKTTSNNSGSVNGNATDPQTPNSEKTSTGSQSNTVNELVPPYGSFVSNHYPGQNGSDNKELSQCNTSPGATCYIKFTQGATIRTLPEKTADQSGSIFWEWNINDADLTSGKWTIEAVAKLGSKTESTTDQLKLEVQ